MWVSDTSTNKISCYWIRDLSIHIPLPQLVEEVEALACCKAVWFALEIGSREIIFKGDTTAVIQVLEKGKKKKKKECVCLNLYEKR